MTESIDHPEATDQDLPWSQVWQLPVLLLGLGLFVLGVYLVASESPEHDFAGALDSVAQYVAANNLDEAEAALRGLAETIELAEPALRGRYMKLWADVNFLQLHANRLVSVDTAVSRETNRKIARYYEEADRLGAEVSGASMRYYARALSDLGREAEALALVDLLPAEPASRRYGIVRDLIERKASGPIEQRVEALSGLIERFKAELRAEGDRSRRRGQEVWLAGLESGMMLDAGDPQRAIDYLLRRLPRLAGEGGDGDLAPLMVNLARAYEAVGELDEAERYYLTAQERMEPADGLNARVLVGLGRIAVAREALSGGRGEAQLQEALGYFEQATERYPSEDAYIEALVGRGDLEARMGFLGEAIEHLDLAVDRLVETTPAWDPRRELVSSVVRSHFERLYDAQDFERALDVLSLLRPLYGEDPPPALMLDFAAVHERIAEQKLAYARRGDPRHDESALVRAGGDRPPPQARRMANQEAAQNFAESARWYRRHARKVTVSDDAAHGASLWQAALNYDQAQRWKDAISVYDEFLRTRPADAMGVQALSRLGKAYLADEQYAAAIDTLTRLREDNPTSPHTHDSLVALARAYVATDQRDAALRTLLSVVSDHPSITPDSAQYRAALIELGKLYYRMGDTDPDALVSAIERLTEAVERYGRGYEGPVLRYYLADAHRRSVAELERRLEQQQLQREAAALRAERERRLERAQVLYNQVITELEERPAAERSSLERLFLRNAYFYQADAVFDRGQYELAIQLYGDAARRWESEPASLVALVQIVNAHCELGQYQEARIANEHAVFQLERMPDEAFEDPALPMTRQRWEDWLRWTSELKLFGGTQALGGGAQPGAGG